MSPFRTYSTPDFLQPGKVSVFMANYLVVYLVAYESQQIRVVRALTRPFLNAPPKASSLNYMLHRNVT